MNPNNFYQGGIPIGSGEVNCNNEAELHPALGNENISQVSGFCDGDVIVRGDGITSIDDDNGGSVCDVDGCVPVTYLIFSSRCKINAEIMEAKYFCFLFTLSFWGDPKCKQCHLVVALVLTSASSSFFSLLLDLNLYKVQKGWL